MEKTQDDLDRKACTVLLPADDVKTYVFNVQKDMDPTKDLGKRRTWQIIPSICGE